MRYDKEAAKTSFKGNHTKDSTEHDDVRYTRTTF